MARRRMIDPAIWQSESFAKLTPLGKLMFIGMFSLADDEGKGRSKAIYLKSVLFPYDDGMRLIDVEKALSEIGSNMSVTFYAHDGNDYYRLDNWRKWQRVDKPQPSIIPDPGVTETIPRIIPESVENDSGMIPRSIPPKGKEVKRKEGKDNCRAAPDGARDIARAVIEHLNQRTGAQYNPDTKATIAKIRARLNEGYKLDDFIAVIDKKCAEWLNKPEMIQYLRPETLFGTKFESYLNAPVVSHTQTPDEFGLNPYSGYRNLTGFRYEFDDDG